MNKNKVNFFTKISYRYFKNIYYIIVNIFKTFFNYNYKKIIFKKRLLIIYDLTTQPFSIGDILTFQQASLVLKDIHKIDIIDFVIVNNQQKLLFNDKVFNNINEDNYFYHLASILPVAQVNPYLGSIHAFNSFIELAKFINKYSSEYIVWPSQFKINFTKEYLYYDIFENILYPYYKLNGKLPALKSRNILSNWAKDFFKEHVNNLYPVTVNIRSNKLYQKERNLDIDSWIEFFKYCSDKYPVKFIIICSFSEIDIRFKNLKNVVVAKDFFTNVEQDLALISESFLHMGAASGPATIAFFSNKPYIIFKSEFHLQYFLKKNIITYDRSNNTQKFFFSLNNQYLIPGKDTLDIIKFYFIKTWNSILKQH